MMCMCNGIGWLTSLLSMLLFVIVGHHVEDGDDIEGNTGHLDTYNELLPCGEDSPSLCQSKSAFVERLPDTSEQRSLLFCIVSGVD